MSEMFNSIGKEESLWKRKVLSDYGPQKEKFEDTWKEMAKSLSELPDLIPDFYAVSISPYNAADIYTLPILPYNADFDGDEETIHTPRPRNIFKR
uniref:DNA-directed RNA polymerase subunit alpha n=1 Tax=Pithovirus LCPAC404 TaxID=2506597 RepID=A0A481ZBZ0_9VIRU|nr:MAG: DNA-directed RNA polymerase subunit alpha [Pithovirus LCPAC404]